jgi:hypothetical protein
MPDQMQFDFDQPAPEKERASGTVIELPHDSAARGYTTFKSEQAAAICELEERFGLILNKHVRLRLFGWDEEFEGKLLLDQLLPPPSRREGLRLRIGKVSFDAADIECCVRLET